MKQTSTAQIRQRGTVWERLAITSSSMHDYTIHSFVDNTTKPLVVDTHVPGGRIVKALPSLGDKDTIRESDISIQQDMESFGGTPEGETYKYRLAWTVGIPQPILDLWQAGSSVTFSFECEFQRITVVDAREDYHNFEDVPTLEIDLGQWADNLVSLAGSMVLNQAGWYVFKQVFVGRWNPLQSIKLKLFLQWHCRNFVVDGKDFRMNVGCFVEYGYYLGTAMAKKRESDEDSDCSSTGDSWCIESSFEPA